MESPQRFSQGSYESLENNVTEETYVSESSSDENGNEEIFADEPQMRSIVSDSDNSNERSLSQSPTPSELGNDSQGDERIESSSVESESCSESNEDRQTEMGSIVSDTSSDSLEINHEEQPLIQSTIPDEVPNSSGSIKSPDLFSETGSVTSLTRVTGTGMSVVNSITQCLIDECIPESDESVSSSSESESTSPDNNVDEIVCKTPNSDSDLDSDEGEPAIEILGEPTSVEDDERESLVADDRTVCVISPEPIFISDEAKSILEKIENFLLLIVTNLVDGKKIEITVQNRSIWSNCVFEDEKFNLLPISSAKCRNIKSTFTLSVIFSVLNEIYDMQLTNRKCTIRELYYKNITVTQCQENVAEALKVICCLLDKTPWQLGVLSSSKGLITGPLQIHLPENVIIDCGIHKTGMLLPHFTADIVELSTCAEHVLVVEKDTVFKKLVGCDILERWNNKCILITGKGYPDMNTRLILKKLFDLHSLPIDIITDADPYGIEIMLTYRHGSLSMSNLSRELAVPSIRWLGIFPSDIKKFGIKSVPLTEEDKRKLQNLLDRPYINDHVHRELLIMRANDSKAEIEGISDSSCSYLIDVYLRNKIDNNDAI